jgi:phosphatidylglycerophosphatase A
MPRLIASWFGSGLVLCQIRGDPNGSGTLAGLLTLPFALAVGARWGWQAQVAAALVVTLFGLWAVSSIVTEEGDAGWIVVDEAAGTLLCVVGLGLWPALVAFAVFRVADILKVPGAAAADRMHGFAGVIFDDLVAALYGLAAGHLLQTLL